MSQFKSAQACTICIGFPSQTAADFLIDASNVVLAREDKDRPFSPVAVEVLKGDSPAKPIDLFLDSVTRRRLNASEKHRLLLVQDPNGKWRSLGVVTPDFESAVRRILLVGAGWKRGRGAEKRAEFFLPLFASHNEQVRELAYLEMARAPYAKLERLADHVDDEHVQTILRRAEYTEWRSLAILLLGHRGGEEDRRRVKASLQSAARFGLTTNLAAWTAAAIEVDGEAAIALIEQQYLRNPKRTAAELRQIQQALSLHGTEGRTELRSRIVAAYAALVKSHPQLAPAIAADLSKWKHRALVNELTAAANDDAFDYPGRSAIRRYLRSVATPERAAPQRDAAPDESTR